MAPTLVEIKSPYENSDKPSKAWLVGFAGDHRHPLAVCQAFGRRYLFTTDLHKIIMPELPKT